MFKAFTGVFGVILAFALVIGVLLLPAFVVTLAIGLFFDYPFTLLNVCKVWVVIVAIRLILR